LVYLIEHRDRVATKQELVSVLWGGRFVSDGVLSDTIYEARRALGEEPRAVNFIKTLHGRGYQFQFRPVHVIETESAPPVPERYSAHLLWLGGLTPLPEGQNFIGRHPNCVVVIDSSRASRHHARVVVSSDAAVLEDLGSKNGTILNGKLLSAPTTLSDGDMIEIGGVALRFHGWRHELSTESQTAAMASQSSGRGTENSAAVLPPTSPQRDNRRRKRAVTRSH
jgi:hypothetical protein